MNRRISGVFNPNHIETLREESKVFIGQRLTWLPLWFIEEEDGGPYVGQQAFLPLGSDGKGVSMGWVPTEDIEFTENKGGRYESEQGVKV